ncbi:hypothetical protein [Vibrio alginolyticus]|uniref:hypothetical protein n=1 Tax=Vibrio alginolyticus TaxID=663 RepID=UPI0015F57246|nr:hypothetical protein [Vibrio alginolyticus]
MGILKRVFTPSFVGTFFSNDVSKQVGYNTAFRRLMQVKSANDEFDKNVEVGFGPFSHEAFLYICALQGSSPKALSKILRTQRRAMKFYKIVMMLFILLLGDLLVDWFYVGLTNPSGVTLIGICIGITAMSYLNSAHKAKQIAIGAIFPKKWMLFPKNHSRFDEGLYRFNKQHLGRYVMTDEDYQAARKAIYE